MKARDPFVSHSAYEVEEAHRRARLIVSISDRCIQFSIPLLLLVAILLARGFSLPLLAVFVLCVCYLPAALLARRFARLGRADIAGYMLLSVLLLIVPANALLIEGFYPILVPGYLLVILTAGLILRPGESLWIAGVAALLFIAAQVLHASQISNAHLDEPASSLSVTIIIVMAFLFMAVINRASHEDLRRALDEATYNLVQANHKLEQASEMKSQFTARTSHELRTPLSSIIAFTDLALRESYGPLNDKLRTALTHVLGSARHLKAIISDILDLSKIEAGQLVIAEEDFGLAGLVEAVQSASAEAAEEKGVRLSVLVSPEMPACLRGDESRLAQILVNLTGNAVKFTERGEVDVRIEPAGSERWRMQVRDTGPGIPEDQFESIFEAYRQLDNTLPSLKIKGTGLGLAITRHLVQKMGGTIRVDSELGKGSIFTVELPLKVGHLQSQAAIPVPAG